MSGSDKLSASTAAPPCRPDGAACFRQNPSDSHCTPPQAHSIIPASTGSSRRAGSSMSGWITRSSGHSADFAAYLTSLEKASLGSLSTDEQLAFWINAYNALTIRNVLDNPGLKQPIDIKGFFDGRKFKVAGKTADAEQYRKWDHQSNSSKSRLFISVLCALPEAAPLFSPARMMRIRYGHSSHGMSFGISRLFL